MARRATKEAIVACLSAFPPAADAHGDRALPFQAETLPPRGVITPVLVHKAPSTPLFAVLGAVWRQAFGESHVAGVERVEWSDLDHICRQLQLPCVVEAGSDRCRYASIPPGACTDFLRWGVCLEADCLKLHVTLLVLHGTKEAVEGDNGDIEIVCVPCEEEELVFAAVEVRFRGFFRPSPSWVLKFSASRILHPFPFHPTQVLHVARAWYLGARKRDRDEAVQRRELAAEASRTASINKDRVAAAQRLQLAMASVPPPL